MLDGSNVIAASPTASKIAFVQDKPKESSLMVYVCEEGACQLPTDKIKTVLELADTFYPIKWVSIWIPIFILILVGGYL